MHIPAPPPPPPPPLSTLPSLANEPLLKKTPAPVQNDVRSALMDSIRKGTQLKKVDSAALSTESASGSSDARSDLLSEIRQGIELKPAAEREVSGSQESYHGTDALADALRKALEKRSHALQSSDDEDESTDNDEWED